MTFLLTHPHSISLTTLSKPLPSSITTTSLPLPSRFPSSATPQVSVSSSGHIYLYCHSSHVIWEYDNKGKRISEIPIPNEKVDNLLPLGEKRVMVHLKGREEVRVMEKKGVRWECINTLQAPTGKITVLVGSTTSTLVAAGSDQGELVVFDHVKGERMVVPLGKRVEGPMSPLLTFSPSHPSTLLLPTSASLLRINLPPSSKAPIDIRELAIKGDILDITFSPVLESSDGSKKGGLCAVLRTGGEVSLIGVDSDSAPKLISFGGELEGLVFIDGATLAGRTKAGSLLVKDLRSLSKPPVTITCSEPITSIRVLPAMPRSSRPSLAPSSTSSHRTTSRTPLGDREVGNIPTPPAVPPVPTLLKGKAPVREVAGTGTTKEQERTVRVAPEMDKGKERVVSAPVIPKQPRQSTSTLRSTSGPVPPNPAVRRIRSESKLRSNAPIILEEDEEVESKASRRDSVGSSSYLPRSQSPPKAFGEKHPQETLDPQPQQEEEYREYSVQLDWAFQPARHVQISETKEERVVSESEMIEELRRELGNLQMDMLRMGRGLRNEIRKATRPLIKELEENKEVIERQRGEIDRLRRGY